MSFLATIILMSVAIAEIQGKNIDSRPEVFNESTKTQPQPSQKGYATKEIILYLTPSQIRALQEGQGLISPQQIPNADNIQHTNAYSNAAENPIQQSPQPLKATPAWEPNSNDFNPIIPPPEYRQSNNAYLNFDAQNQLHIPKPIPFFPDLLLIPQEALPGTIQESDLLRNQLKEQWYLLDEKITQLKALEALHKLHADKYNKHHSDNKYALNDEHQLKAQYAHLQAAAIPNSPSVVVHKQISVKHSPVHLIKQVKVPVPTPVLVPVPEPFSVNAPQPYPVPLDIIKPVPVPIVKTHKTVERPVPFQTDKLLPFSGIKSLYAERPYFLDQGFPLEGPSHKTGSFPIHSHVWHH